jgi:DNA polymerase-3 subunit alpha
MGLTVERPAINQSLSDFTVTPTGEGKKVIRFGLGAVKGVGEGAVEVILEARKDGGFLSVDDFCQRVDTQKVNRRVIEALIKAGAFDGLPEQKPVGRARTMAALEAAIERGASAQRDKRSGQTSLFGLLEPAAAAGGAAAAVETYPGVEEWTPKILLAFEKESLGFYISGHPLDRYRNDLTRYASATTADFAEGRRGAGEAAIGGVVSAYRERPTKRGDGKLAFFQLEDQFGQLEVIVFPKTFEKVRAILVSDEPILCSGKVADEGEDGAHVYRLLLEDAQPLAALRQAKTSRVEIHLNADAITADQIADLKEILEASKGGCHAVVRLKIAQRSETIIPLGEHFGVSPSDDLLNKLERLFGHRVASFS